MTKWKNTCTHNSNYGSGMVKKVIALFISPISTKSHANACRTNMTLEIKNHLPFIIIVEKPTDPVP